MGDYNASFLGPEQIKIEKLREQSTPKVFVATLLDDCCSCHYCSTAPRHLIILGVRCCGAGNQQLLDNCCPCCFCCSPAHSEIFFRSLNFPLFVKLLFKFILAMSAFLPNQMCQPHLKKSADDDGRKS